MKHYSRFNAPRTCVFLILALPFVAPIFHSPTGAEDELPYTLYDDDPFGGGVKIYATFQMERVEPKLVRLIESEVRSKAFFGLLSLHNVPDSPNPSRLNIDVSVSTVLDLDQLPFEHQLRIVIDEGQYHENPTIAERVYYYVIQRIYGFSQGLCFAGLSGRESSVFLGIPDEAVEEIEQGYIIHDIDCHIICLPDRPGINPPTGRFSLFKRDNQELDPAMHQALSEVRAKVAAQYRDEGRPLPDELATFDLRKLHMERNQRVAIILAEDYEYIWQSPTDLNSYGIVWRHPTVLSLLDGKSAENE